VCTCDICLESLSLFLGRLLEQCIGLVLVEILFKESS